MRVHILGIGGTFMAGIASIASEMGYQVTGADQKVYPPMSEQLFNRGINFTEGYQLDSLSGVKQDEVVIGNVMSRGMPLIEHLLSQQWPLQSGPEWLSKHVLKERWVLAVSGTHGKTTTASMLAWILEFAGLNPGFLIGGIPNNFNSSARLGSKPYFVIEADEYDSAFFDKRSKFVHYRPKTLIINTVEFDHADIFSNMDEIKKQFHHMIRMMPKEGLITYPHSDTNIQDIILKGCWCETVGYNQAQSGWRLEGQEVYEDLKCHGLLELNMIGQYNYQNALAAIIAATHIGIDPKISIEALKNFKGVKRRQEVKAEGRGGRVIDDFAHHPTAIQLTVDALKHDIDEKKRIIAVVDLCSNTMKKGTHKHLLPRALKNADKVYFFHHNPIDWDLGEICQEIAQPTFVANDYDALGEMLIEQLEPGDQFLCMSNGAFSTVHRKLAEVLEEQVING